MTDENTSGSESTLEEKSGIASVPATDGVAKPQGEDDSTAHDQSAEASGEEGDEGDVPQQEQPKPAKRGGFQKKIERLTREVAERDRLIQLLANNTTKGQAKDQPAPSQVDSDAPPKADDFDSYEDYITAKARHTVQQELKRDAAERQKQEGEAKFNEVQTQFAGRLEKASEVYADFDDAMENLQGLPAHPMVATALMQSEKGVDVLYWLGTNPEEAARIHKMHPLAQVREIGRIEATLSQPAARKVTQAKAPPTTLKGGGTAKKDPNAMSMDEYVAWRKANP